MMASWTPLVDLVIVGVVGIAFWISYLALRGEELRRELVRKAKDPAHWPTTRKWDGDDL